MYKITTNFNHAIAGKGFYSKGMNSSVTLEQSTKAICAMDKIQPSLEHVSQAIAAKVDEYNSRLPADPEGKATPELLAERKNLFEEIDNVKSEPIVFEIGDDKDYIALLAVMEQSVKAIYKMIQDKNEGGEVDENNPVPTNEEFGWLCKFEGEVKDAEKLKS